MAVLASRLLADQRLHTRRFGDALQNVSVCSSCELCAVRCNIQEATHVGALHGATVLRLHEPFKSTITVSACSEQRQRQVQGWFGEAGGETSHRRHGTVICMQDQSAASAMSGNAQLACHSNVCCS